MIFHTSYELYDYSTDIPYVFKKKKNPYWDRKSADDQDLPARTLFTEENSDGEI